MKFRIYSLRFRGLKLFVFILLWLTLESAVAGNANAAMRSTKTVDGLKATLSVSPKMADLLLVEAGCGRALTNAAVTATLVYPNGQKRVKKLMGMKMGEVYSYMNSIDITAEGIYTFHIIVKVGKKIVNFDFENLGR